MGRRLIPPEFVDALDHVLNKTGPFVGPVRQGVLWDRGTNLGELDSPYPTCRPEEFDREAPEWFHMHGDRSKDGPIGPVYKKDQHVSYADWEGPEPGHEVRVIMYVRPHTEFQRSPTPEGPLGREIVQRASFVMWVNPRGDTEPWRAGAFGRFPFDPRGAQRLRDHVADPVHPVARELRAERWRSRDPFPGGIYAPPGVYC